MDSTGDKVVRVGLIGLGEVAQLIHLPILQKLSGLYSVEHIFDVSDSLCHYIQKRYNVPWISRDYEELCSSPDVDVVMILSPDHYHDVHAKAAMDAGKYVFIEKPVCLTRKQLEKLSQHPREKPVMVGYMRRYAPAFLACKDLLPSLAAYDHVHVQDIICEGPFYIRQTNPVFYPRDIDQSLIQSSGELLNRYLQEICGSDATVKRGWQVLTGLSSHSLSAMRELLGMPQSVVSAVLKKNGEALSIVFDYGHFCAVYQALINNVARFDAGIEIFSDRKKIKLNYPTPYIRNLPATLEIEESSDTETSARRFGPYYTDAFEVELKRLHSHMVEGTEPKTNLEDSMEDFVLFEQILQKLRREG